MDKSQQHLLDLKFHQRACFELEFQPSIRLREVQNVMGCQLPEVPYLQGLLYPAMRQMKVRQRVFQER
jgi:hypothetical protein